MKLFYLAMATFLAMGVFLFLHESEEARELRIYSTCTYMATPCHKAIYNRDTDSCEESDLDDGEYCRGFVRQCVTSCICRNGEPEEVAHPKIDDHNPCTSDYCMYKDTLYAHIPKEEGTECGPNSEGTCQQGNCLMPTDEPSRFTVYRESDLSTELINEPQDSDGVEIDEEETDAGE
jgi:hypothetical protein